MRRYYYIEDGYYYIGFSYSEQLVREVKKFSGAAYNPENREWYIPYSLTTVTQLRKWLEDNHFVEGRVYTPSRRVLEYAEPQPIIDAEGVLMACTGLNLKRMPRLYQAEGIAYMVNHGNCINGDDCGLGKTTQAIITVELLSVFPCLVITPASVKFNWRDEWGRVQPDRSVSVIDSSNKQNDWTADVVVINYDNLYAREKTEKPKVKFKELIKRMWGSCIIDEIHFLKSRKAIRTKLTMQICRRIPNVWGLTGTLTQNRPSELIMPYKVLRRFDEIFGSVTAFNFRYCNARRTQFGMDCSGSCNLEELYVLLTMGGYIRRNKREVLDELPPLVEQVIDAPISNMVEYLDAENDVVAYLQENDVDKVAGAVNAPYLVMLNTLRQLSIKGKLNFIKKYIAEWLEANEGVSLVVFGVHREPLQVLADEFSSPVIQGGISPKQKHDIVNRFRNREFRLLFANIQSAGTGTDGLQEVCSNLFYIELPDTSTEMEQTTSRLERMGQKGSINVTYLMNSRTIDVEMMETIYNKEQVVSTINRGVEGDRERLFRIFSSKHGK